jgi:AraC family transcriptional activator of tynA and feaB
MAVADLEKLNLLEIPKSERTRRWNEFLSDTYSVINVEPELSGELTATVSRICIGRLGLSWFETSAASGISDTGKVGSWAAPIGDAFILAILERGTCVGHYLGREIISKAGDMVLLDAGRDFSVHTPTGMAIVCIKIPGTLLLKIVPDPEEACGVLLPASNVEVALASALVISIKNAIEAAPTADWEANEDVLISVISSAMHHLPETNSHLPKSGSQKREACAFIEKHLGDPDLNIRRIAAELDVSTRSIQRIFEDMGFTPRGYILERRLDMASERLRRPDCQQMSVTDIAYGAGFSDLSHFVRCFRRKFGVSPRDFRTAQAHSK